MTESVKAHLLGLIKSQPDLTLAELQERTRLDQGVSMSWGLVHLWVVRLGLRLRKSRSTQSSAIPKRIGSVAPRFHRHLLTIDPQRLVFLDESSISTTMTRVADDASAEPVSRKGRQEESGRSSPSWAR